MSENHGQGSDRDENGRFVHGNRAFVGRKPRGKSDSVKIVGASGVALGAHDLLGEFDRVMTKERWSECIQKLSDHVISHGSVRAFDSLWKMKERLLILSGTESVNMDRLLDALENYASMSDNSNLSDTPEDTDPTNDA